LRLLAVQGTATLRLPVSRQSGELGGRGCWCELLANTVLGWWWLDPLVALGIAALAVCEGTEAWHGEESGC